MGRRDADSDWVFARCREVQADPDGYLDLWAREHYKSTIITFALSIQDILNDPETTIGIFSHTRPIAKAFLKQIKRELETNETLKGWFPDILYENPAHQSPKWSEDDGLIVKRKTNPKEATVEAWGVVDGQPTGKHFNKLVYDDLVTRESVNTPEMIAKTTDALALSYNLGAHGGARRFIGTRYHFNDTYREIIARGTVKPRIYPATKDGKVDGEPVFLTRQDLATKRRDMGPYVFSCFVAGTPILTSDWGEMPIEKLRVGDEVVGYTFGKGQRSRLVAAKVLAVQSRSAEVVRMVFESGRALVCTPDHKFWHGRSGRGYAPLGLGPRKLNGACSVYDPREVGRPIDPEVRGYLAGMFDGEGAVSGNTFHFHQGYEKNRAVCDVLEQMLTKAGFPYSTHKRRPPSRDQAMHDYYITGGRSERIRFARMMRGYAKGPRAASAIFEYGSRFLGHRSARDKLVAIEPVGRRKVFNIQTETGNYVAGGYAVKNCQMLQDPTADEAQGFKEEWIKFATARAQGQNIVLLFDPASAKKKSSDYTAGWAIGLGADRNIYVHDMVRDRLSLTERAQLYIAWHRKWRPIAVGIERYGMMADIEYLKEVQEQENYRFDVTELGGSMAKNDRIRRLIPWFEKGRIFLHPKLAKTNYEGRTVDLTKAFIDEEYKAFPVAPHDDMLDALSRFLDENLPIAWPAQYLADNDEEEWQDDRGRNPVTGY